MMHRIQIYWLFLLLLSVSQLNSQEIVHIKSFDNEVVEARLA